MGPRTTRALAVIGATAILVVGVNAVSYAATGKSLLLGKTNKASTTTTIQNTKAGPALSLKTKSSASAPLKVNGKGKVVNLNADKVDGLDGAAINKTATSALAKANAAATAANDVQAIRFRDAASSRSGNTTYALGSVPAGTYLISMNASLVPTTRGTQNLPNTDSCYLQVPGFLSSDVLAQATTADTGVNYIGLGFTNVLTFTGSESLQLVCATSTNDGWSYSNGLFSSAGEPPTISFTKIDGVSNRSLTP